MSRSDHVSVGDESSPTSAGLPRLRGSQEQQSRPWKLICLRFFSANTLELIMNILSSLHFTFWPINVTQKRKRIETMPMVKHKKSLAIIKVLSSFLKEMFKSQQLKIILKYYLGKILLLPTKTVRILHLLLSGPKSKNLQSIFY